MAAFISFQPLVKDNVSFLLSNYFKQNDSRLTEYEHFQHAHMHFFSENKHAFIQNNDRAMWAAITHMYSVSSNKPAALFENLEQLNNLQELDGLLSFVYHRNNECIYYVDHLASQPLYYCHTEDIMIVSNNLSKLVEFVPDRGLNQDYLNLSLNFQIPKYNSTPFHKIHKIPPGYYISVNEGVVKKIKYWASTQTDQPEKNKSQKDLLKAMEERLLNFIDKHEKITGQWSGGLDSSLVTYLAIKPKKAAYNFYHHYTNIDVHGVSHLIGLNQYETIKLSGDGLINQLYEFTRRHKMPLIILFPFLSKLLYKKAHASKSTMMLSGFGGDEMISSHIKHSLFWHLKNGAYLKVLKYHLSSESMLKGLAKFISYYREFLGYGKPQSRLNHLLIKNPSNVSNKPNTFKEEHRRLNHHFLPTRIEFEYLMGNDYNLKHYYPMLDKKVMETYFSIPKKERFAPLRKRNFMRKILSLCDLDSILNIVPKQSLTIPTFHNWYKENDQNIRDFLDQIGPNHPSQQYINIEAIYKLHQEFMNGTFHATCNPSILVHYLSLIIFLEEFTT